MTKKEALILKQCVKENERHTAWITKLLEKYPEYSIKICCALLGSPLIMANAVGVDIVELAEHTIRLDDPSKEALTKDIQSRVPPPITPKPPSPTDPSLN